MSRRDSNHQYLRDRIRPYFSVVDPVNKRFKCNIELCKSGFLSGIYPSNLIQHVKTQHGAFFAKTFGALRVPPVNNHSLAYRRLKYIQRCTEIVTVNGLSFTTLNASGIRGFADDELEVLQACGFGQNLSAPHYVAVKTQIRQLKNAIQEEIKREVQGKMIAAMADSATLHNKSILAIFHTIYSRTKTQDQIDCHDDFVGFTDGAKFESENT